MTQPEWKLVGRIGDCNPVDYGGGYVFVDTTGVYCPEVEWVDPVNPDKDESPVYVYRFTLENCFYTNGVLSDNEFHKDFPVWFADSVAALAEQFQEEEAWLIEKFCSDDPMERAFAWQEVAMYWGWDEMDGYPLSMTYAEAEARYSQEKYKTRQD